MKPSGLVGTVDVLVPNLCRGISGNYAHGIWAPERAAHHGASNGPSVAIAG